MNTKLLTNKKFILIMVFYLILSLALAASGYFFIHKVVDWSKHTGALVGLILGIVISIILWYTVGKNFIE